MSSGSRTPTATRSAAEALAPLVTRLLGSTSAVRLDLWDGSHLGPADAEISLRVTSSEAIRHLLWAPGELGLARAHVIGLLDIDGDLITGLSRLGRLVPERAAFDPALLRDAATAARSLGVPVRPPSPPPEEARPLGVLHSRRRDAQVVGHHYDISNDFYRLLLGPSMTYSCARFTEPEADLATAQDAKHDLVAAKLGLGDRPDMRLLDVGCGWGSMAVRAATVHDARVVGVTISRAQAELARKRVAEAGVGDRVEIRLQDYRDVDDGPFDAISSIGMFEHVGAKRTTEYFGHLRRLLAPRGRLLNHAISSVGSSAPGPRSFVGRYVFPDGHLIDVGEVIGAMQQAGFEVRDLESLREHYARTVRLWLENLEGRWDEAVRLVGERRARVWRLYLAGSAVGFDDGGISVHQVLGVLPTTEGSAGVQLTRRDWV